MFMRDSLRFRGRAGSMAAAERWYFTKEQLACTPSRKCGLDADKELSYRQQAANLIQDMGQRLQVTQLCINTAIVYMHRFYYYHSFTKFHRNSIAACALFLAAKVEEQPRKLEHVIKVAHMCLHRDAPTLNPNSEAYQEQALELVLNENMMLQTLGFDIGIEHPHTHVVNFCQLVRASKDLAQTSYFMATNSLHLTMMCLQYKPRVVACLCIHLACKWSNWEIPKSSEDKDWFWYVEQSCTAELLEELTSDFLAILDKCPIRLKRKIMSGGAGGSSAGGATSAATTGSSSSSRKDVPVKKEDRIPANHDGPGGEGNSSRSSSSRKPVPEPPASSRSSKSGRQDPTHRSPVPPHPQPMNQGSEHLLSPGKRKDAAQAASLSLDAYRDKQHRQRSHRPHPTSSSSSEHRSFQHLAPPLHPSRTQQSTNHDSASLHPTQQDSAKSEMAPTSISSQPDQSADDSGGFNFGMGYPAPFEGGDSIDSFPYNLDNPDMMAAISPLQFDHSDSQEASLPCMTNVEESNGMLQAPPPVAAKPEPRTPPPVKHRPQTPPPPPKPRPQTPPPPVKARPATPPQPPPPPPPPPAPVEPIVVKQEVKPELPPPPPPPPAPAPVVKEKERSSGERRERKERHKHKHSSSERSRSKHSSPAKHGQERLAPPVPMDIDNTDRVSDQHLHRVATEAQPASLAENTMVSEVEEKVERNGIGKHDRKSSSSSRSESSRREKSERRERKEGSREKNGSRSQHPQGSSGGLKITITKEKLQQSGGGSTGSPPREALKIKIPKLKIVPPTPTPAEETSKGPQTPPPPGLKLKISKERLNSGRKRDRRSGDEGDRGRSPKSRKTVAPPAAPAVNTSSNSANHLTSGGGVAPPAPFVNYVPPPQFTHPPPYFVTPFGYAPPPMHLGTSGYHQVPQYFGIPPPPPPPLDPPLPKEPPLPPPPPPLE